MLEPAPPHKITMAAGVEGGSYDYFAKKYADYFKQNGFELEIRHTAGSVENYELLKDEKSGVDVALVQGGTTPDWAPEKLQAVCSVYFEPLWVFYRDERPITQLSALRGKRLAIGAEGSGARSLALRLLQENRIKDTDVQISDLTGVPAADALIGGQVDAVFLVISPGSPAVQKLLRAQGVQLMSFAQADAYARRNDFLSKVTLYKGVMDLGAGIPAEDVQLVSPAAMIVARPPSGSWSIRPIACCLAASSLDLASGALSFSLAGGGAAPEVRRVATGLLGADYSIENGRYKFARVYDGESWNPQLRAPLTQPGVNVAAGEYLLEVEGQTVRGSDSVYRFFEGTVGKRIRIKVGPKPTGEGAREETEHRKAEHRLPGEERDAAGDRQRPGDIKGVRWQDTAAHGRGRQQGRQARAHPRAGGQAARCAA